MKPKSWLKTVATFANSIGGKIIFGIFNDKELVGIGSVQTTIEKITDYIDKFITPKIVFKSIPREENGKSILVLDVNPGSSTPYYYRNEGTKTAFIRNGSSNIEAPDYVLNEFILKGTGKTYDGIVTGYKKSDFSFSILEAEVCMNIYDDRMEITSPGIMVSGDPVPEHVDYAFEFMRRNPNIADVFWRMGYMNRRGSGLSKITNSTNALFSDGKEHVRFHKSAIPFSSLATITRTTPCKRRWP